MEVENDKVRVCRIRYGPHEKSPMHGHPALVVVFLTDGHSRLTYPEGKTDEVRTKSGDALWFDAFEHLPENLADQPFEAILVELKV